MSFLSTVVADLKWVIAHPATVRKAILGGATTVLGDLAVFNGILEHVPGPVQAVASVVTAVATAIVVFLTPNATG